ncbi:TadE family type IV pilus minor pilin [Kutzneria kofuensis]|uniref:TadE family type IV pilus minor pilin n=1 Tax=Kutzneria kofuensis TaxID=103725 RepID=UPI0028AA5214|nr:TadE family type IV pilus minor pilin [Kutzneria kofuensis]
MRSRFGPDRGAVTVEAAIAICGVIAMLALGFSAIGAVVAGMRSIDAAAEVARLVARGDRGRGEEAAKQLGPDGADVSIKVDGDEVSVTVTAKPVPLLLGLRPSGTAYAVLEPGASG